MNADSKTRHIKSATDKRNWCNACRTPPNRKDLVNEAPWWLQWKQITPVSRPFVWRNRRLPCLHLGYQLHLKFGWLRGPVIAFYCYLSTRHSWCSMVSGARMARKQQDREGIRACTPTAWGEQWAKWRLAEGESFITFFLEPLEIDGCSVPERGWGILRSYDQTESKEDGLASGCLNALYELDVPDWRGGILRTFM